MKVLAIDTSSYVMGIAVIDGDTTLGEVTTNIKKNHSIRLMPAIAQLMKDVDVQADELDKIVVANGPGSYTGVRIGVTTAKTMAWSLGIPVIGVSSLAVMAQSGRFFQGFVSPIMDARRGQVYTGLYTTESHNVTEQESDRLILLTNWLDVLVQQEKQVLFTGQDVAIHQEIIKEKMGEQAQFSPHSANLPRPCELAWLGNSYEKYASAHDMVPNYHQLAEAEAKWQQAQKEKGTANE